MPPARESKVRRGMRRKLEAIFMTPSVWPKDRSSSLWAMYPVKGLGAPLRATARWKPANLMKQVS